MRHPADDVIVRGEPAGGKFSVVYLRDGRLAAVDTVAALADFRPARKLIVQGARIDPILAADPGIPLTDTVLHPTAAADLTAARS